MTNKHTVETSADEDILYEDLYEDVGGGRKLLKTSIQEMEERLEQLQRGERDLQSHVETLQKKVQSTEQEKNVLIRNISCLFKTAQLEVARKDKQIQKLQEELLSLKSQSSCSTSGQEKKRQASEFGEKRTQVPQGNNNEWNDLQENHHKDTKVPTKWERRDTSDNLENRNTSHSSIVQKRTCQSSVLVEGQLEQSYREPLAQPVRMQAKHKDTRSHTQNYNENMRDSFDRVDDGKWIEGRRYKASYESRFNKHFGSESNGRPLTRHRGPNKGSE